MTSRPLRVALTGGIATGKSYCLARFAELGAATLDADLLARQAVAPGTAGFSAVVDRFGAAVVGADGALDRAALGRLVFSDPDARRALEAIVHPVVYGAIERWLENLGRSARSPVAIADIPLLYETGRERDFDEVVVCACPAEMQLSRLVERGGLTAEEAERRIQSQLPIAAKVRRADHVIDTSGTFEDTDRQVREVWAKLSAGGPARP